MYASITSFWKNLMLRDVSFASSFRKLRLLYAVEDPWHMSSDAEQHRFEQSNVRITEIAPRFESILEFGCGEGHQTQHLSKLTDSMYGMDISEIAVGRARRRCPHARFAVGGFHDAVPNFGARRYDLVTACEVLYYCADVQDSIKALQTLTNRIYVSNYLPRAEQMRHHFTGPGWRRLADIRFERLVWECYVWDASNV